MRHVDWHMKTILLMSVAKDSLDQTSRQARIDCFGGLDRKASLSFRCSYGSIVSFGYPSNSS
jgi:hypothetical protein